jgi:hypothetical protein
VRAEPKECLFWATHAGAELNLLIVANNTRLGFEIRRTSSPRVTKSMGSARESVKLDGVAIVHAGEGSFPLQEGFRAISYHDLLAEVQPLPGR